VCVGLRNEENEDVKGEVQSAAPYTHPHTHAHKSNNKQAQAIYYSGLNPKHLSIFLSVQINMLTHKQHAKHEIKPQTKHGLVTNNIAHPTAQSAGEKCR